MPAFATPGPIQALIRLPFGDGLITASGRTETVVKLHSGRNGGPECELDVSYRNNTLIINGHEPCSGLPRPFDLEINLPEGSRVQASAGSGGFHATGRLGACGFHTGHGEIWLDETGPLTLVTTSGDLAVNQVHGHVEVLSDSGALRIDELTGSACVRTEDGEIRIGLVNGEAGHVVSVRSVRGDIRIGEIRRGPVQVTSTSGDIRLGISGAAATARLDLKSSCGRVHSSLGT